MSAATNPSSNRMSAKQKKQIRRLIFIFVVLILATVIFLVFILKCTSSNCRNRARVDQPAEIGNQSESVDGSLADALNDSSTTAADSAAARENLADASAVLSGTSLVTTSGQVINGAGQTVKNEAAPMTGNAPKLSAPLDKNSLPAAVIKLEATTSGFKPTSFTVSAGQAVSLALTSSGVDSRLVFQDPNLRALELPVPLDYTLAKTFNAPATPGEYVFYQDIPGRSGETGRMIVK